MDHEAIWIEATEEVKHVFLGEHNEHKKRLEEALSINIYITELVSSRHDYNIRQIGSNDEIRARLHPLS